MTTTVLMYALCCLYIACVWGTYEKLGVYGVERRMPLALLIVPALVLRAVLLACKTVPKKGIKYAVSEFAVRMKFTPVFVGVIADGWGLIEREHRRAAIYKVAYSRMDTITNREMRAKYAV